MISSTSPAADGSRGTAACSPVRQSSSNACPAAQSIEADWSMIPHGTPTKSFSARLARAAISDLVSARPANSVKDAAAAHATAAEEASPAPGVRSESIARLTPPSGLNTVPGPPPGPPPDPTLDPPPDPTLDPASADRSAQTTPAG